MKRTSNRYISGLLIMAMLLSLLMPVTVLGAGSSALRIKGFSTDPAKPSAVTSEYINVTVATENIDDTEIGSIYYEIQNVSLGSEPVEVKTNKAVKTSASEVVFNNIKLSSGTNKLTVISGDLTKFSSDPVYIIFTPTSNITDLEFNEEPLLTGGTYPKDPTQTTYTITGMAANAKIVQGYLGDQANPVTAYRNSNGAFTFIPNRTDLVMQGGDNYFKIVASNDTITNMTETRFVFNNGQPYLFNAQIAGNNVVDQNTLELSSKNVSLTGKLKVDISAASPSVTKYVYADIQLVHGNIPKRVYFRDNAAKLTEIPGESTNTYKVFDLGSINLDTDLGMPDNRDQTLIITFYTDSGLVGAPPKQTFHFKYVDASQPYISSVSRVIGQDSNGQNIEVPLNPNGNNELSELPVTLIVNTKNLDQSQGGDIKATVGDKTLNKQYVGNGVWNITVDGIRDGITKLEVVPVVNSVEKSIGKLEIPLVITSTPYIIPINFYNGLIIKKETETPKCSVAGSYPCIEAKIMNLPTAEYDDVEVIVNDRRTLLSTSDFKGTDPSIFMVDLNPGDARWSPPIQDPAKETHLKQGRNTIKFNLKLNNTTVTSVQYEIFYFTIPTPGFTKISPIPLDKFTEAQTPDKFVTHSQTVSFTGAFVYTETIKMTVRAKDSDGKALITTDTRNASASYSDKGQYDYLRITNIVETNANFTTADFTLPYHGDVVFEFAASNKSGVTEIKTITISREPVPYEIIYPTTIKDAKGEEMATVNGNFVDIRLSAENATSVQFGKDTVFPEIDKTNNKPYFNYRYEGLKAGKTTIKLTVYRGTEKTSGSFIVNNVNTSVEGAQWLETLKSSYKLFEGDLQLKFPKDTKLMRNDPTAAYQYLTSDRKLLFGIANVQDGRVSKNYASDATASFFLKDPENRFRPASKLYWINGGYIGENDYQDNDKLQVALTGSGRDPYDVETTAGNVKFYQKQNEAELKNMVIPTKRGELTLNYDPSIRADAWKYVTVYQMDIYENYRGMTTIAWKNIGGVVDKTNNTITVPIDHFGYFQVMYLNDSFTDITSHAWGRDILDTMYAKGYMTNMLDGYFMPNEDISRGEFATLLVKTFDIPLNYSGTGTFSDVQRFGSNKLYDYKYIETAARVGIVRGTQGGRFSPNDGITRQDAAVMIARAAELKVGTDSKKVDANLAKLFTDAGSIDPYAKASVEAVAKEGYIEGIENVLLSGQKNKTYRFDPTEPFSRVQAAAVLERILKKQKKFPK
ncbi:S-layer homology domain-containing protein [Paenibacillus allorhizosphaerae]|uniref:SLH domain-containing protein n=1 Tax=Paenibacillus allorhizosphaerae TaxID=2849866 RepID=A0ABM8VRM1_9BACL|nr:S-layer homology domain-containing protein [Paenibacillus allorhizosphaerae]CAG7655503.1 hypothetical protein PAECIP111802_06126 [Paenibacillus allorhizosphaerae]